MYLLYGCRIGNIKCHLVDIPREVKAANPKSKVGLPTRIRTFNNRQIDILDLKSSLGEVFFGGAVVRYIICGLIGSRKSSKFSSLSKNLGHLWPGRLFIHGI